MLKEYVKQEFFDLPECLWYKDMVIEFIIKSIELDTDVYEAIIDIEHADLYQHMAEDENYNTLKEMNEIKAAMYVNAKEQINLIINDIEADLECEDESEDQRLEAISFDNQRLIR